MTNTDDPAESLEAPAGVDMGGLGKYLGVHVRLANIAIYRDFSVSLADLDITQMQLAVLVLIEANVGISQVDIAAALGTDRATMMAMVDRLEARDLLRRERSSADRRRQHLYLTPAGAEMLTTALARVGDHEARLTSGFSPEEVATLVQGLRRIHQQL
jgi:DNA-binding MarR family transcriptional regulator